MIFLFFMTGLERSARKIDGLTHFPLSHIALQLLFAVELKIPCHIHVLPCTFTKHYSHGKNITVLKCFDFCRDHTQFYMQGTEHSVVALCSPHYIVVNTTCICHIGECRSQNSHFIRQVTRYLWNSHATVILIHAHRINTHPS